MKKTTNYKKMISLSKKFQKGYSPKEPKQKTLQDLFKGPICK